MATTKSDLSGYYYYYYPDKSDVCDTNYELVKIPEEIPFI